MTYRFTSILIISLLTAQAAFAQDNAKGKRMDYTMRGEVEAGDTIQVIDFFPVVVFPKPVDLRKNQRLIYNVKKVYPIAKFINRKLAEVEVHMATLDKREQHEYIKKVEQELKEEYTPILRKMSLSQGKVLIKLVDRETNYTSYELVQQLRGKLSAFFWQNIARIFGANLKTGYDKTQGEDKMIEQIIVLYEAGLI